GGEFFPVFSPAFDGIAVFLPPLGLQLIQSKLCGIPVGGSVNPLHIGCERFSVLPDYKTAGISDLVDDADLFGGQWKHASDSLGEAFELSVAVTRISSTPLAFRSVRTLSQKEADSFLPSQSPRTSFLPSVRRPTAR